MANPSDARRAETQERAAQDSPTRMRIAAERAATEMRDATETGTTAAVEFAASAAGPAAAAAAPEQVVAPAAEAGFDQGRRMMEATLRVADLYREAGDRTAEDVQAMLASMSRLGAGMQRWQHACFDLMQQSIDRSSRRQQALWNIRSPMEWVEFQRDGYVGMVQAAFTAQTVLLQLAGRIAQEAVQPLEERARGATQG